MPRWTTVFASALLAAAVFALPSVALADLQFTTVPSDQTCPLVGTGTTTCKFTLPAATGATGGVTYSWEFFSDSDDPPPTDPGTAFDFDPDPDTREFTANGRPAYQTAKGWPIRYKAEDDNETITAEFRVKFDGKPLINIPTTGLNPTVGEAVDERLNVSGNGPLTMSGTSIAGYHLPNPGLSTPIDFTSVRGISFRIVAAAPTAPHRAGLRIFGTPEQAGYYQVKLKLYDDNGQFTQRVLEIYVNGVPSFGDAGVPNAVFPIGEYGELVLPPVTLGNGDWTHHVVERCALPSGLDFSDGYPAALKIFGTATSGNVNATFCDITVKDSKIDGYFREDPATIRVCFSVGDGASCEVSFREDASVPNQVWPVDTPITQLVLPKALRSTGTATYSIAGLPDGIVFNDGNRTLSGTPTEVGDFTATYTATDKAGEAGTTDTLTFLIEVDGAPSFPDAGSPTPSSRSARRSRSPSPKPRRATARGTTITPAPGARPCPSPSG